MRVIVGAHQSKGIVKRSPKEELALRVRVILGRHLGDVYQRVIDELGDRAEVIGPIDMSRNPLRAFVRRLGTAYLTPPLVSGLTKELATLFGDMSASVTVDKYARAGGRPMPTRMLMVAEKVLRFRLGCNYAATLIGWSDRSRRPFLEVVTPDDLEVEYLSDDPIAASIIRHSRTRMVGGQPKRTVDVYDLTDHENPSYRVFDGDQDITEDVHGQTFEGDAYWWRYEDGRPFHRIVIHGDPREPYQGVELVEGTLSMGALYSHWKAGVRDAGHPQRNAVGLHLEGMNSDAETGETGGAYGPETVARWHHDDPERPGTLHQWGPGFDPEVTGRAIRTYELGLVAALGLPVDFERTGGEPTETERKAMGELIASTFAECRGHDGLVLWRTAAVANRASAMMAADGEAIEPFNLPERVLGVLYRDEVTEALETAPVTEEE